MIEFKDGKMKVGERVPGGYVFVDGVGVGDVGPMVMRERGALARDGFVVIHLCLDRGTGSLAKSPEIISKGFVFIRESEEMFDQVRAIVRNIVKSSDHEELNTRIEKELSKFFYTETKRRPMIIVITSESPQTG
jgi:ribonuclease J